MPSSLSRSRSSSSHRPSAQSSSHSSSSSSSDEEDNNNTVAAGRKRKRKSGKKGKKKSKKKHDEFEAYRRFAQWYLRSDRAFVDYTQVLEYGIRFMAKQYGKLSKKKFAEKHAAELDAFFAMKDRISSFDELLKNKAFLDDFDRKHGLAKLMNDAAGSARGNDIKGLLDKGLVYLALELPQKRIEPTIPATLSKDKARGHHHVVFSRLLCPVRLLKEFDKNPEEYRKKILRGNVKFNDQDFPSMLYPLPDGYDPADLDAGLLQNQTAVRFFKHIFTSPTSALGELGQKPRKRSGQAKINRMIEVTPGSIAYSFLMFWYNISSISDWRTDDDLTDRSELYDMVLGLFEEREEDDAFTIQWRKDTLDWWNYQVFGIVLDDSDAESEDESSTTTLKLLHAQRAQKAAAATAAAALAVATTDLPSDTVAATQASGESPSHSSPNIPVEQRSAPPDPSPLESLSSLPVEIPQTATPPRSSPAPVVLATPSRQPLSPAHRLNVESEAQTPVHRPTKFSRSRR